MPEPATPDPARVARLVAALEALEAAEPVEAGPRSPASIVRAPGRVNLLGEHTDYNDGLALPVAIALDIWLACRSWGRAEVEVASPGMANGSSRFSFDGLDPARAAGTWIDYVAGVAWAAGRAGLRVHGFRGVIDSTLPIGTGLSSSAAIEMAAALALLGPGSGMGPVDRARLGRACENDYVGVGSGLMDQLASAAGVAGHALRLDCRSLEIEPVAIPAGLVVVACDTGSRRSLKGSEYAARRADCEAGVRLIAEHEPGVTALRDVTGDMLERHRSRLPERVWRRCQHVVEENDRVDAAVAALRADDREALGRIFAAAHASARDLFEIVSPEQDAMVEVARSVPGVVAARMTGGGFGGCTVNLVEPERAEDLVDAVASRYPALTGLDPHVYVTAAVDGADWLTAPG
jgi:galactokinase